jgi:N-methylhydantoinase A
LASRERIPLLGIDTGGTFTDLVLLDEEGGLRQCKVLSTPDDPSRAIGEGLRRLGLDEAPVRITHGTTVGTNAVLEGKGSRVAYVTSRGFADVLALGRQQRREIYRLCQPPVAAPVPEERCLEIATRAAADGELLERADDAELEALRGRLRELGAEAVAVNLLFSFLCPAEEERIAALLGDEFFVSLSSRVLPEIREYERGIATWLNASVGPVISRYLTRLTRQHPRARISVMQSSGSTVEAEQAADQAVRLLLSGPAGGIAAAQLLGRTCGRPRMMTLDMGGTSTDVALLDGEIPLTSDSRIGPWPLTVETVDIHTIGAGGGSVARVDEGGLLLVGPESAGADPGPACYGRGGRLATVTDANLVLGRLPRDTLLGGYLPLDRGAAERALDRLADRMGCDRGAAAAGVVRVANEHMARALRVISVERGHDPRNYLLTCFGGAGGLHACELADLLGIRSVMLPALAGVLSAQGMLASRPGRDLSRAVLEPLDRVSLEALESQFAELELEAREQLAQEGVPPRSLEVQRRVELRYRGQSQGIVMGYGTRERGDSPAAGELEAAFHAAHRRATGHELAYPVELVNLRLSLRGPAPISELRPAPAGGADSGRGAGPAQQEPGSDGPDQVPVFRREELQHGAFVSGPAIVLDEVATAWVAAGWRACLDEWRNLVMERPARPAS